YREAEIGWPLRRRRVGYLQKKTHIFFADKFHEKRFQWFRAIVECLFPGHLSALERLPTLAVDVCHHRLHDQHCKEKRQADQHLIGGRPLGSEGLPEKMQYHG